MLKILDDIDYQGVTGSLDIEVIGDLATPGFVVYWFTPENTLELAEWATEWRFAALVTIARRYPAVTGLNRIRAITWLVSVTGVGPTDAAVLLAI